MGGRKGFHEFVLSGNEEALENFYNSKRHSSVLGRGEFARRVRGAESNFPREYLGIKDEAYNLVPSR